MRSLLVALIVGVTTLAGCLGGTDVDDTPAEPVQEATGFQPYVLIGIPDTGINPYHEMYYRADRVDHPCTYIQDFPCDLEALPLSVGTYDDWDEAFAADQDVWDSVEDDTWYWIPQTVFVAVSCESSQSADHRGDYCILDDGHMHGTGTTASALMENPDLSIAFKAGGSSIGRFLDAGLPVDIFSVSWGHVAPIPLPAGACLNDQANVQNALYIKSSGNEPGVSSLLDCWSGNPNAISVGGAYAEDGSQELLAYKEMDVVSYFCRPVAQTMSVDEIRESYCGTSFSGPTVAGALSKVIYQLRNATGYTGGIVDGMVAPDLNITIGDLRSAMNRTASYDPESQYPNTSTTSIPVNSEAPWLQWGWGFYDGLVAEDTIAHLIGESTAPEKSAEAVAYMDAVYTLRGILY